MATPTLIATDLDGTLLGDNGVLTQRAIGALTDAALRGITIVAVTARPPRVFDEWTELATVIDSAICSNGAIVYSPAQKRVEQTTTLSAETARLTWKALSAAIPDLTVAVETGFDVIAEPAYTKTDSVGDRRVFASSAEEVFSVAPQIVKLLVRSQGSSSDELLQAAREVPMSGVELCHSGGSRLIEISAAGVSKAAALRHWCVRQGVASSDVVAFGDMPNDVPMLEWAGLSFAVANAHPDARAAAGSVCGFNVDDGVAHVVEKILNNIDEI